MQLTERHIVKSKHPLYPVLDEMTLKAKNLYNAGLYAYRQSYFDYRKGQGSQPPSWQAIDKQLRQNKAEAMSQRQTPCSFAPLFA